MSSRASRPRQGRRTRVALLLATAVLTTACRTTVRPEVPSPTPVPSPAPVVPVSSATIPIALSRPSVDEALTRLARVALRPLETVREVRWNNDDDRDWVKLKAFPHDDFAAAMRNDGTLGVSGGVEYDIEFKDVRSFPFPDIYVRCPSGGQGPRPRMRVGAGVAAGISPDWSLVVPAPHLTTWEPYTNGGRDKCEITIWPFTPDVQKRIAKETRGLIGKHLAELANGADGALPIRRLAERAWKQLQAPVALGDNAWLVLAPESVGLTQPLALGQAAAIGLSPSAVTFTFELFARPQIVLGTPPQAPPVQPLPALRSAVQPPGFSVSVDIAADRAELSQRLNAALTRAPVRAGRRSLTITQAQVLPSAGDTMVLAVDFRASWRLKGAVYLRGIPELSDGGDTLRLRDLKYDIKTRNILTRMARWIAGDAIQDQLAARAKWDLAPKLEAARAVAQSAINRDLGGGIQLSGNVTTLRPQALWMTPSGVRGVIAAVGTATVVVDPTVVSSGQAP